jgi:hypothetical protein
MIFCVFLKSLETAIAIAKTMKILGLRRRFNNMNKQHVIAFLIMLVFCTTSHAFWHDKQGNPAPATESMRSIQDFGGSLIVTSDLDWQKKWNTPVEVTPEWHTVTTVKQGQEVVILTFFSNPKLNDERLANISCDIKVIQPDGVVASNHPDLVCFRGEIKGSTYNIYLAEPVMNFIGEPTDPIGMWTVEVTLKDNIRKVVLPMKTTFTLE